jgi:hypothetical protein
MHLQSTAAGAAASDAHFFGKFTVCAGQAQQLHPRDFMAKVKLGSKEFAVDSEIINANYCGVTDADCVALAALMKSGKMPRLKRLSLVRLFSVFFVEFPPSPHVPSCAATRHMWISTSHPHYFTGQQ